jgi:hypothetical protein
MLIRSILPINKLPFFLAAAFFFLASSGGAETYYVDATNGQDTNTGLSEKAAWKTIAKINGSSFNPGDQILFKKGETWREQLTIPSSGSLGNPITFGAYGAGNKPVISGANARAPTFPARSHCILLQRNYVIIDTFELEYPSGSNIILTNAANYNIVRNCTVKHSPNVGWKAGIILNRANYNLITGNTVQDCHKGIVLSGYHVSEEYQTDNNIVSRNTVLRINDTGISIEAGSQTSYQPAYNIIEYNDVSSCSQTSDDTSGIGTSRAGRGNIIRYNKSYNNGIHPVTMRGTGIMIDENSNAEQVYYNICYGNTSSGIATSGDDTLIYNNTCYNNAQGIYLFLSGLTGDSSANSIIKNNIIVALGAQSYVKVRSEAVVSGGNVFDNNCYYGSTKTKPFSWDSGGPPKDDHNWIEWRLHNPEPGSLNSDPKFVSTATFDFHLLSSSPCVNAGADVGLTSDYDGNGKYGESWNIGAYEWKPSSALSQPRHLRTISD